MVGIVTGEYGEKKREKEVTEMPGGDGTGPLRLRLRGGTMGLGLMKIVRTGGRRGMGRGLLGLSIPFAIAVVHDISQPDGHLRPYFTKLLGHAKLLRKKPPLRIVETSYDRIEGKQKETEKNNVRKEKV